MFLTIDKNDKEMRVSWDSNLSNIPLLNLDDNYYFEMNLTNIEYDKIMTIFDDLKEEFNQNS